MNPRKALILATVAAAAVAVPASAQQSGPVAVYWVSAATTSGLGGYGGGDMAGADTGEPPPAADKPKKKAKKKFGLGSVVGGVVGATTGLPVGDLGMGGGDDDDAGPGGPPPGYAPSRGYPGMPGSGGPSRTLNLQLGSSLRPTGAPSADHLIPAGMGMGPSLPLVTPTQVRPEPGGYDQPYGQGQKPKGKMLIYWGCGEHAPAPPIVIDFAKLGQGAAPNFPTLAVNAPQPPAPGRFATYGEWPNPRSSEAVPMNASLVGAHTVQGTYSPAISFSLGAGQDFMAPLNVTSRPSPGGGNLLSWNAVPTATGYFAWLMGAPQSGEKDTLVLWSSSAQAVAFSALMDYLPPAEVRRLIGSKVVMAPTVTQCTVPAEVMQGGTVGMAQMIAYGDEANFADPPKPANPKTPWNLKWTVKVRFKSTATVMVGLNM